MDKIKYLLAIIGGAITVYSGIYAISYALVTAAVIFDLVTGCIAAIIKGEGLSSKVAVMGLLKKSILLVALGFGTFLDIFIPYAASCVDISLPSALFFSTSICVYIVMTECISIFENIIECTDKSMPMWILKLLKNAKKDLEGSSSDEI